MSRVAHRRGTLIRVWLITCALVLLWAVSGDPLPGGRSGADATTAGRGSALVAATAPLQIDGDLTRPVSPGVSVPLDLRLSNTQQIPLVVTQLTVAVEAVSAPGADAGHPCTVDDFVITQPPAGLSLTLRPHERRTLSALGIPATSWPTVGMRNGSTDQAGCKGASITLAYAAVGTSM